MGAASTVLDEFAPIVAGDLSAVPAKRAVCLLVDEAGRPVQMLAWADPRAALRRRMAEPVEGEPTRRIKYGEIVRGVRYRRVYSDFESDVVYAAAVQEVFPDRAGELLKFPEPWFVQVDLAAEYPRWTATTRAPATPSSLVFGPLPDRATAGPIVEALEDLFDLCRGPYHHILAQAPHGKACAYKEMGRCPAPCDGSVAADVYREMARKSADALLDPSALLLRIETQMTTAAAALEFERAGRLKTMLERARVLTGADLEWAAPLEHLAILSVQGGPEGWLRVFLIDRGGIQKLIDVASPPDWSGGSALDLPDARSIASAADAACAAGSGAPDIAALGPAMRHLFGKAQARSAFCRLTALKNKTA